MGDNNASLDNLPSDERAGISSANFVSSSGVVLEEEQYAPPPLR